MADPSGNLSYGTDKSRGRTSGASSSVSGSKTYSFLNPMQLQNQKGNINAFNRFRNNGMEQYRGYGDAMNREAFAGLQGVAEMGQQYGQNQMTRASQYGARSQQGFDQLRQYAMGQNPMLNNQIQQFGQDIGQNLNRNIMPGINAGFQNAGQRGSSRQGIAQGLAAQGALQQFQRGATELRSNAYNQGLDASKAMTGLGLQGYGTAGGLGAQMMGQSANAYGQMAPFAQNVADIQQFAYNAQFTPFQVGAEVIGDPTALSRSQSWARSNSNNMGFTRSGGENYGLGF
jgi:hypothetical protein